MACHSCSGGAHLTKVFRGAMHNRDSWTRGLVEPFGGLDATDGGSGEGICSS